MASMNTRAMRIQAARLSDIDLKGHTNIARQGVAWDGADMMLVVRWAIYAAVCRAELRMRASLGMRRSERSAIPAFITLED
jgi:hypothetical protein